MSSVCQKNCQFREVISALFDAVIMQVVLFDEADGCIPMASVQCT